MGICISRSRIELPINEEQYNLLKQSVVDDKNIDFRQKLLKQLNAINIDEFVNQQVFLSRALNEEHQELFRDFYQYRDKYREQPLSDMPFGDQNLIYRFSYDENKQFKNCKRILVIGKNRVGKSKFINALANSLIIGFADKFRYHIAEYDQIQTEISECNLMEPNAEYQFLEAPAYTNNSDYNQKIMNLIYEYLTNKRVKIDFILICRAFRNEQLSQEEKQIIFNLTEIFGKSFIKKTFIINTQYDLSQNQLDKVEESLNRINKIYEILPEPKMINVNSEILQSLGLLGLKQFRTIESARDAILGIIKNESHQALTIRESDTYRHRREQEQKLKMLQNDLQNSLQEAIEFFQNYFAFMEKSEEDEEFQVESITFRKNGQIIEKELQEFLRDYHLNDNQVNQIEREATEYTRGMAGNPRWESYRKQQTFKIQMQMLKQKYREQKENLLMHIQQTANEYIKTQSDYLEDTFWDVQITQEQFIAKNMPPKLIEFFQKGLKLLEDLEKDPILDERTKQKLRERYILLEQEFEQIKQRFPSLGNDEIYRTQILGGVF